MKKPALKIKETILLITSSELELSMENRLKKMFIDFKNINRVTRLVCKASHSKIM